MRLSLDKVVSFWGKSTPNKTALQHDNRAISYSELSNRINRLCGYNFAEDIYGLIINDNVDYVVIMLCLMRKKIKFVNIGHIVCKGQLDAFLKFNSIKTVITDDDEIIKLVSSTIMTRDIIKTTFESPVFLEQNLEDNVGGFLSSGSTGIPKIYFRDQYSLISEALLWIMELNLNREKSFYISKPFTYIGSFVLLYAVLYSGGKVIFPKNYIKENLIPQIDMDFAFIVPTDIRNLIQKKTDIHIDNIVTMGAPISPEEKKEFSEIYNCNVYEMWGNSEGLATITNLYENPNCDSVGRATFTDEIFIIDENGQKLPANTLGIIAGITDNGTVSDNSTDVIESDDMGFLDSNGELHLIGRKKNVILFSDNSYFCTTDLESEIKKQFSPADCVVILIDKVFYVFLVSLPDIKFDELNIYLKEKYSKYANEISIGHTILIDKIPYNSNGKIDYMALRNTIK